MHGILSDIEEEEKADRNLMVTSSDDLVTGERDLNNASSKSLKF